MLVLLAPYLDADVRRPIMPLLGATDASCAAAGSCVTKMSHNLSIQFFAIRVKALRARLSKASLRVNSCRDGEVFAHRKFGGTVALGDLPVLDFSDFTAY